MAEIKTGTISGDGINKDATALREKELVMRKQRVNSFFYSVSDTFKFVAGLLITTGMALFAPALPTFASTLINSGIGAAYTAIGTVGAAGVTSATIAAVAPIGLTMIGLAALAMGVAITSNYISSRYYTTANYDSLELNAQHTARYLVKEIEAHNKCIAEQQAPARADGRSWGQFVRSQESGVSIQSL